MKHQWMRFRKMLLRKILPILRLLPLPLASRIIALVGRAEYLMFPGLRSSYRAAVARGATLLDGNWNIARVSQELAGNQVRWRVRDLLLDDAPNERASGMFRIEGRECLDEALALGKGVLLLGNHFGAHMLPPHWVLRAGYPIRFYMERPRHISKVLAREFDTEGPLGQSKLFISRRNDAAESATSILRAAKVLHSKMVLFLAGDVRWTGQHTASATFLGHTYDFATTWVSLAAMTGAAVVPVFCQMERRGTYHIEFEPHFHIPHDAARNGGLGDHLQKFLHRLEEQIKRHPSNSNEYFFWPDSEDLAA